MPRRCASLKSMQVLVANPQLQTALFSVIFLAALLLSIRKAERGEVFPASLTRDLKGFAILTVVFAHIGYGLSSNNAFLWPFSTVAGVGVNMFLFVSGLGLVISQDRLNLKPLEFYRRRFGSLLAPLWIMLAVLYAADYFLLHKSYPAMTVVKSFFGVYTSADLYRDPNSPLWYLTFLFSYYLVFPFIYRKRRAFASAVAMLLFGILFTAAAKLIAVETVWLYVLHCVAFPLGMAAAMVLERIPKKPITALLPASIRLPLALLLVGAFAYGAVHSGVGHWQEQFVSVMTMLALIEGLALLNVRFGLLGLFGAYSYEIYLLHWPLMYRYDFAYKKLPPYLATALYLGIFLVLGWALQRLALIFEKKKHAAVC